MLSVRGGGKALLLSVGMLLGLAPAVARSDAAEVDPNFHLYLLIGQSNMAGRGAVDAESNAAHPRVLMLTKDLEWKPATDPLHFDKSGAGVGPGLALGKTLAEAQPDVKIGLVPCAVGGSRIEQWAPEQPFRKAMSQRINAALEAGVLKGILWHQGESNLAAGARYTRQLSDTIESLRDELHAPDAPFVAGEITDFRGGSKGIAAFNAAVHRVGDEVKHFACVPTQDLKDKGDRLHYDTASSRALGRRYAQALLTLQSGAAD